MVKFGENSAKFSQNLRNFGKKTAKNSAIFNENFEIRERWPGRWPGSFFPGFRIWIPKRCKGVHCVDLGESFPTSIYLQKSASIQPRTSHSIFIILAASRDLIFTERSSPCAVAEEAALKIVAKRADPRTEVIAALFRRAQGVPRVFLASCDQLAFADRLGTLDGCSTQKADHRINVYLDRSSKIQRLENDQ